MKTIYSKLALIVVFITASASSCEKEKDAEPKLPEETQTGANTFGCYVNDVLFLKEWSRHLGTYPLQANYWKLANKLIISAQSNQKSISFSVLNPEVNKKITLLGASYYTGRYFYKINNAGDIFFTRFDLDNLIISGTFAFEIPIDYDDGNIIDTIKVTQGRFDIKINDYNIRD